MKVAAVSAVELRLETVKVMVLVASAAMVEGPKAFTIVGATGFTVRVAAAGLALLPLEVCKASAEIELLNAPPTAETTTGVPMASDSNATKPKASFRLGTTVTSD